MATHFLTWNGDDGCHWRKRGLWVGGSFKPAAWQVRRARVALEQWNAENPERFVAWEWVEEALISWRAWKERQSYAPHECQSDEARFLEFSEKLPAALLDEIFPKPERSRE